VIRRALLVVAAVAGVAAACFGIWFSPAYGGIGVLVAAVTAANGGLLLYTLRAADRRRETPVARFGIGGTEVTVYATGDPVPKDRLTEMAAAVSAILTGTHLSGNPVALGRPAVTSRAESSEVREASLTAEAVADREAAWAEMTADGVPADPAAGTFQWVQARCEVTGRVGLCRLARVPDGDHPVYVSKAKLLSDQAFAAQVGVVEEAFWRAERYGRPPAAAEKAEKHGEKNGEKPTDRPRPPRPRRDEEDWAADDVLDSLPVAAAAGSPVGV
jgi:hypothetical protein